MIQDHLYIQSTVTGVLDEYIKELLSTDSESDHEHAEKLKSYSYRISDTRYIRELRKFFNGSYKLIARKHPQLKFLIEGRRKSLISVEKKILQYIDSGKSLDFIRDFYAFRILLFGGDSLDLIQNCYQVVEEIIEYAEKKGFTPCKSLKLLDVSDTKKQQNEYYESFKYKEFVKDYICFPKENGYESIHLVLQDKHGYYLEIQIRTLEMHARIESSDANHEQYKETKYTVDFPLERDKISVYGYAYANGKVFDKIGIEVPMKIFNKQNI